MKKLPVPIIVSLIFLAFGYLYCAYFLVEKMINDTCSGRGVAMLIILLLLTLFIVGAYAAVITRHSRSVLLLGMILPIVIFVFIGLFLELILTRAIIFFIFLSIGITFIIWSDSIDDNESSTIEDISIKKRQKYKYWLYSAIIFCIAGFAVGILSKKFIYFEDTMLLVMVCLLLAGILQFVIYYIICKIRAFRAKKICSEKP